MFIEHTHINKNNPINIINCQIRKPKQDTIIQVHFTYILDFIQCDIYRTILNIYYSYIYD